MFKKRLFQTACGLSIPLLGAISLLALVFYLGKPQPSVDYVALINKPALQVGADEATVHAPIMIATSIRNCPNRDLALNLRYGVFRKSV